MSNQNVTSTQSPAEYIGTVQAVEAIVDGRGLTLDWLAQQSGVGIEALRAPLSLEDAAQVADALGINVAALTPRVPVVRPDWAVKTDLYFDGAENFEWSFTSDPHTNPGIEVTVNQYATQHIESGKVTYGPPYVIVRAGGSDITLSAFDVAALPGLLEKTLDSFKPSDVARAFHEAKAAAVG